MKFCWAVRRWFVTYLEGELERGRAEAVERHVRRCLRCRGDLEDLRRVSRLLRSLPSPTRPAIYWGHAMARLRGRIQMLPEPGRAHLWDHLERVLAGLPQAMIPVILVGVAIVNTLGLLGLEEESFVFFVSYVVPLVFD